MTQLKHQSAPIYRMLALATLQKATNALFRAYFRRRPLCERSIPLASHSTHAAVTRTVVTRVSAFLATFPDPAMAERVAFASWKRRYCVRLARNVTTHVRAACENHHPMIRLAFVGHRLLCTKAFWKKLDVIRTQISRRCLRTAPQCFRN